MERARPHEPRVHSRDEPVVGDHLEVGHATIARVDVVHARVDVHHRRARPRDAHGDLGIEVHAVSARVGAERGIERIDTVAAERIADHAAALERGPEDGDAASDAPAEGRAAIEDRLPEHERAGLGGGRGEEARDVVEVVLTIGVDLERVGVAERSRKAEAGLHGGALAAIRCSMGDVREAVGGQRRGDGTRLGTARVVDDDHIGEVRPRPLDHAPQGLRVLVRGDQHAGAERHRAASNVARAAWAVEVLEARAIRVTLPRMQYLFSSGWVGLAGLLLVGCGDGVTGADAATPTDASTSEDTGASIDGGATSDDDGAVSIDAARDDARTFVDAMMPDAVTVDAFTPDAYIADVGPRPDAPVPFDCEYTAVDEVVARCLGEITFISRFQDVMGRATCPEFHGVSAAGPAYATQEEALTYEQCDTSCLYHFAMSVSWVRCGRRGGYETLEAQDGCPTLYRVDGAYYESIEAYEMANPCTAE